MPPRRSQPRAVRTGETVPVGDVSWQEVTNARQATQLSSRFGESKHGNFVRVGFNLPNSGGETVILGRVPKVLSIDGSLAKRAIFLEGNRYPTAKIDSIDPDAVVCRASGIFF